MRDLETKKHLSYQKQLEESPSLSIDPEIATGQILQIVGKEYYRRVSEFEKEIAALTKTQVLSWRAYGLTKLSPERDSHGKPVTNREKGMLDFNLLYPRVDMSFSKAASVANDSIHANSGDSPLATMQSMALIVGELSAQEHHIINDLFNQSSAVSTVKLLDLAQQKGSVGIAVLTSQNYQDEGGKPYTAARAF